MSNVLTDEQTKNTIAERVSSILEERGISRIDLARMVGEEKNRMAITRICNGMHMPSAGMVGRIADALGVSVDYLYGK